MMRPNSFKGLRNQPIKVKPPVPMEIAATLKRQGMTEDDYDLDRMSWDQGAMPKASNGIFATDPAEEKGAFGGMASAIRSEAPGMTANLTKTPPMAEKPKEGPGLWDYLGLAGATLSEIGSDGRKGSINDFMDRRTAATQQSEMNSLLEGLDLTPEELGMVKAGQGQAVLAQRIEDQGEDKRYSRGRADTIADRAAAPKEPPWAGATQDESGNWIYDPDYLSGQKEMGAQTASGSSPGGRVQSTFVDDAGNLQIIMGDGNIRDTGRRARDSYMNVDIGGVPNVGSRYTGGFTPLATPEQVGNNRGAIAVGEQLGKTQAEAITTMPGAISTADQAIASIDELLNSSGFDGAYGMGRYNPLNMLPGSDAKNAEAIRDKLDGQFFINAVSSLQTTLAPVSDADARRLVASVSQLTNKNISSQEARRVAGELKNYFNIAKQRAAAATQRGPLQQQAPPQAAPPQQRPTMRLEEMSDDELERIARGG
jgi:hypothetical protein